MGQLVGSKANRMLREIVLRRLDRCAAPRAALAELLERREVDPRVATEVLDRLEAAGVIDDDAYATTLARTRFAEKGAARRAIADELRVKGLGEGSIASFVFLCLLIVLSEMCRIVVLFLIYQLPLYILVLNLL